MLLQNKLVLLIPVIALALACNKTKQKVEEPVPFCKTLPIPDDSCSYWNASPGLVSISGPNTGIVGQPIILTVSVTGTNGCADSALISGNTTANTITLTGDVHYSGCICTQALMDVSNTFTFNPSQPGTYTFQGNTYEGNPVTHTVVVQ